MLPFIDFYNFPFKYEQISKTIRPYFAFIVPRRNLLVLDDDTVFFRILDPICMTTNTAIYGSHPINLPIDTILYDLGI